MISLLDDVIEQFSLTIWPVRFNNSTDSVNLASEFSSIDEGREFFIDEVS